MFFRLLMSMITTKRRLFFLRHGVLCLFLSLIGTSAFSQNEFPGYIVAQIQTIKAGSLIIPMDTIQQQVPGYFNLKSYGLVNALLQDWPKQSLDYFLYLEQDNFTAPFAIVAGPKRSEFSITV